MPAYESTARDHAIPQDVAPKTSYLSEIHRKVEVARKTMEELEACLGPVLAPSQPEVMRGDRVNPPHNAISEVDDGLAILVDRLARILRRLEI